jgi:hypothetical protein
VTSHATGGSGVLVLLGKGKEGYTLSVSQKNTDPARLVWHHPGRPSTNACPALCALSSVLGSLHPACVNTEMVVMNL